jgi:hypothetical protein
VVAKRIPEAFRLLGTWYLHRSGNRLQSTIHDINATCTQLEHLYSAVPPPGDPIPVHIAPADVDDYIPTPEEIYNAGRRVRRHIPPGPSRIRVEDLLYWHGYVPDAWASVLALVIKAFDCMFLCWCWYSCFNSQDRTWAISWYHSS